MHEAKEHKHNAFLTLTLNDENLFKKYLRGHKQTGEPLYSGSLHKRQLQLFMKRLRKALGKGKPGLYVPPGQPPNIKYYAGGEYGEQFGRPHYHVCLFGTDFNDKKYLRQSPTGEKLYRSPTLEQLWPMGFSTIGAVTFESAAYVARYIMKKQNGKNQKQHYEKLDLETGEIIDLQPEYNDMSRAEGIGKSWLKKYTADVYGTGLGKVIIRGKQSNAPRYYDKQFKKTNPHEYADLKLNREMETRAKWYENTHERLRVREQVAEAQIKQLKRKL